MPVRQPLFAVSTPAPEAKPVSPVPSGQAAHALRKRLGFGVGLLAFALLLLVPPPAGLTQMAWQTAAVGALMAAWWMTEAIPIAVTSLLPLLAFPVLGILPIQAAAAPYAHPLIFLFMGGFMIALAMERWRLHKRLALLVIQRVGTQPKRIIAGFMLSAAFLSMWISNTATALMMLPIGMSVVALVQRDDPEKGRNFAIVLMLGLAYACSIGGMGTLIGTPTNALLAAFLQDQHGLTIGFLDWMRLALPLVVIGLAIAFFVLTRWVYPIRLQTLPGGRAFIEAAYQACGPVGRGEWLVGGVFVLTAALWVSSPLLQPFVPGLSDTGIALFGAVLLFVLPVDAQAGRFVLHWEEAKQLPWGVLLLFGGGLSLAQAISETGLAAWIGSGIAGLAAWPLVVLLLLLITLVVFLTELTSNTATAAAFLPVLASVAAGIGQPLLLLLVPATLAASCAFMLPVATPPNAIVYSSSWVTIPQMARAGVVLNVLFIFLLLLIAYTVLPLWGQL